MHRFKVKEIDSISRTVNNLAQVCWGRHLWEDLLGCKKIRKYWMNKMKDQSYHLRVNLADEIRLPSPP